MFFVRTFFLDFFSLWFIELFLVLCLLWVSLFRLNSMRFYVIVILSALIILASNFSFQFYFMGTTGSFLKLFIAFAFSWWILCDNFDVYWLLKFAMCEIYFLVNVAATRISFSIGHSIFQSKMYKFYDRRVPVHLNFRISSLLKPKSRV